MQKTEYYGWKIRQKNWIMQLKRGNFQKELHQVICRIFEMIRIIGLEEEVKVLVNAYNIASEI